MPEEPPRKTLNVLLKVGVFALIGFVGMWLAGVILLPLTGYFVAAVMSVFLAALAANWLALRIYERAHVASIGLYWNARSRRNLLVGLLGGLFSAYLVTGGPLVAGAAHLEAVPGAGAHWRVVLFYSVMLLFGAFGEEMLFRGYGFQALLGTLGSYATILPVSVLFGLAHIRNQNVLPLGVVNTVGWGILLGYAFLRSGDLWLPIGLHFGWNWTLPLLGVNLSGFTMRVTGYEMRWKAGQLWSGGDYGPEASLLTTAVLVLLFVYLAKAPVLRQTPPMVGSRWEE